MRMKTWESYVKEESFVVELIKIVIDIEFQYASARNVPRHLAQTTNVQSNYHKQVLLQSSLAYHSLYGGQSDEVIVMDSINQSINNRKGIITQFFPERSAYGVRLATKRVPQPSLYEGEYHVIQLKFLTRQTTGENLHYNATRVFHAVITTLELNNKLVEVNVPIHREMIDAIRSNVQSSERLSISFVRGIVMATKKREEEKEERITEEEVEEEEEDKEKEAEVARNDMKKRQKCDRQHRVSNF